MDQTESVLVLCSRCTALCLVVLVLLGGSGALGQVQQAAEARIDLLNRKAMDEYDTLEFEAARAALVEAIGVARSAGVTGGAVLTQTYLNLGIVYGAGLNDRINAVKYFAAALRTSPDAALNPARATPALEEMFNAAKEQVAAEPPPTPAAPAFQHTPVDEAVTGRPVRIRVRVRGAQSVLLFYRTVGSSDFQRVVMQQVTPGLYVGAIPAQVVAGRSIYYYVEAHNAAGERVQGHGTALSPNIITVRQVAGPGPGPGPGPGRPSAPQSKVFSIGLMVGAGLGIVNGGESEHAHPQLAGTARPVDINPGGALAPFHAAPELSYHLNRDWHICVLGRIQLVNAVDEGNKISLLGEARAKRFFGDGDFRFYMAFGAGAGQIRHRIPLGDYDGHAGTPNDLVDTRVAGIGAFGLGGGFSYMFSSYVGLALEVNGLIMVPDFAANLDVNSGLVLSF